MQISIDTIPELIVFFTGILVVLTLVIILFKMSGGISIGDKISLNKKIDIAKVVKITVSESLEAGMVIARLKHIDLMKLEMDLTETLLRPFQDRLFRKFYGIINKKFIESHGKWVGNVPAVGESQVFRLLVKDFIVSVRETFRASYLRNNFRKMSREEFDRMINAQFEQMVSTWSELALEYPCYSCEYGVVSVEEVQEIMMEGSPLNKSFETITRAVYYAVRDIKIEIDVEIEKVEADLSATLLEQFDVDIETPAQKD